MHCNLFQIKFSAIQINCCNNILQLGWVNAQIFCTSWLFWVLLLVRAKSFILEGWTLQLFDDYLDNEIRRGYKFCYNSEYGGDSHVTHMHAVFWSTFKLLEVSLLIQFEQFESGPWSFISKRNSSGSKRHASRDYLLHILNWIKSYTPAYFQPPKMKSGKKNKTHSVGAWKSSADPGVSGGFIFLIATFDPGPFILWLCGCRKGWEYLSPGE